jgi:manganese-dependent inorganic pyrophosphatase
VRATFDPVGSTATLVIERFRQNGMEPSRPTRAAARARSCRTRSSSTRRRPPSATTRSSSTSSACWRSTRRVRARDVRGDLRHVGRAAREARRSDVKEYSVSGGHTVAIAQVETVGPGLLERRDELLEAMRDVQERKDYAVYALMVTGHPRQGLQALVVGNPAPLEQAFGEEAEDGVIDLPGVMSRKKQVAPKVLAAF